MLPSHRHPGSGRQSGSGRRNLRLPGLLLCLAVVCALLGAVALTTNLPVSDLPVARWCRTKPLPKELMRLLDFSEIFAHGVGVASVLAALLVIDPTLRPRLRTQQPLGTAAVPAASWLSRCMSGDFVRLLAAIVTGGLLVDILKVSIVRIRPRAIDLDAVASAWATFGAEALATAPGARGADLMSLPSGHSAMAAGLAAGLTWKYPHAWPAFATFASLAVAQRLFSSAHYPSDAAFGAALGLVGAAIWLRSRPTADSALPPPDGPTGVESAVHVGIPSPVG